VLNSPINASRVTIIVINYGTLQADRGKVMLNWSDRRVI
jgi:hypothetical protein